MATPNHFLNVPPAAGEDIADPTNAGRPHPTTYKQTHHLDRGTVVWDRTNPDGTPAKDTNYGRGQSAVPSSVDVKQSNAMTDWEGAHAPDPVLAQFVANGMGDRSGAVSNPIADLTRKIDPSGNVDDAYGMQSARARQPVSPDSVGERGIPSVLTQAKGGTGQP